MSRYLILDLNQRRAEDLALDMGLDRHEFQYVPNARWLEGRRFPYTEYVVTLDSFHQRSDSEDIRHQIRRLHDFGHLNQDALFYSAM